MRFTSIRLLALLAVIALVVPAVIVAQSTVTGAISGVVTDQSGAVLPDINVTLKSVEKGFTPDDQDQFPGRLPVPTAGTRHLLGHHYGSQLQDHHRDHHRERRSERDHQRETGSRRAGNDGRSFRRSSAAAVGNVGNFDHLQLPRNLGSSQRRQRHELHRADLPRVGHEYRVPDTATSPFLASPRLRTCSP